MIFEFFYDENDMRLTRRPRVGAWREELIGGEWVRRWKYARHPGKKCSEATAKVRMREHLVKGTPGQGSLTWGRFWQRLIRHGTVRWFFPFLPGGGRRRIDIECANSYRRDEFDQLRQKIGDPAAEGTRSNLIEEQAEHAMASAASRVAAMEERATMLIGASGLTTTLVLTNAGLFGEDGVGGTMRMVIFIILGLASFLSLLAGARAIQVTTINWDRGYPDSADRLAERASLPAEEMEVFRAAALVIAARRAVDIGSWKSKLLAQARSMFLAAIFLVFAATVCFVISAMS